MRKGLCFSEAMVDSLDHLCSTATSFRPYDSERVYEGWQFELEIMERSDEA